MQELEKVVKHTDLTHLVDFLAASLVGMNTAGKLRPYMATARTALQASWISNREIKANYEKDHYIFLRDDFLSDLNAKDEKTGAKLPVEASHISKQFNIAAIRSFALAVATEIAEYKQTDAALYDKVMFGTRDENNDDSVFSLYGNIVSKPEEAISVARENAIIAFIDDLKFEETGNENQQQPEQPTKQPRGGSDAGNVQEQVQTPTVQPTPPQPVVQPVQEPVKQPQPAPQTPVAVQPAAAPVSQPEKPKEQTPPYQPQVAVPVPQPAQKPQPAVAAQAPVEAAPVPATSEDFINAMFTFQYPVGKVIDEAVRRYVDGDTRYLGHISDKLNEAVRKLQPNVVVINSREPVQIAGDLHASYSQAVKLINVERQAYFYGEIGSGKTTLAEQIAKGYALPFGFVNCVNGLSESNLLGQQNAKGEYIASRFVHLYENGGLFLFDKIDDADANTMLIITSALANGCISVPSRPDNPTACRHKDFYCICVGTIWNGGEYIGKNAPAAAFLDLFPGSKIHVGYDVELEKRIANTAPNGGEDVLKALWTIRKNVNDKSVKQAVSTRAIKAATGAVANGDNLKDFVDRFVLGWGKEDRDRALSGVEI